MEPLRHDAFASGIPSIGLVKIAEVEMPTDHADFRCVAYADGEDGTEQLALVLGDVGDGGDVMVRLHSECFTVDAILERCYAAYLREFVGAARILRDLGVQRVQLLTNNPAKVDALLEYGFEVEREAHWTDPTDENADYLQTKRDRMGHVDDA